MANTDVVLSREELFDLAQQCAANPRAIVGYQNNGSEITWSWCVVDSDKSQGLLNVSITVDPDRIAKESAREGEHDARTWVRPHRLTLQQRLPDGTTSELLEFEFAHMPLGIEQGGIPRPALAALIARQSLPIGA